MKILWADDDGTVLQALVWVLEAREFAVTQVTDYTVGVETINNNRLAGKTQFEGAIVDVILAQSRGEATFASNLGIRFARDLVEAGVKRIAFVTVVPSENFNDEYEALLKDHPDAVLAFFDKLALLDPGELKRLCSHLRPE